MVTEPLSVCTVATVVTVVVVDVVAVVDVVVTSAHPARPARRRTSHPACAPHWPSVYLQHAPHTPCRQHTRHMHVSDRRA